MATCVLCTQKFAGESELDSHLTFFHNLDTLALSYVHNLKSLSNDGDVETEKGWIFLSFIDIFWIKYIYIYILNWLKNIF